MNKLLKLYHHNTRSINQPEKQLILENIVKIYKIDFISLNETFLNPNKNLDLQGFKIYRSDQTAKMGGGAAICVKSDILGQPIYFDHQLSGENIVGFKFKINNNNEKIAIFSYYSSPTEKINEQIFKTIRIKYKKIIILGDLNAKHAKWSCKTTNEKGSVLESILKNYDLQIVNNKTPIYPKSKNILDLTIMSIELMKYFKSFQVLKKVNISDHQPTITTLIEAQPCVQPKKLTRIDWSKFKELVDCSTESPVLDTDKSVDEEVEKLTKIIQSSLEKSP
jgi:exonuclease III